MSTALLKRSRSHADEGRAPDVLSSTPETIKKLENQSQEEETIMYAQVEGQRRRRKWKPASCGWWRPPGEGGAGAAAQERELEQHKDMRLMSTACQSILAMIKEVRTIGSSPFNAARSLEHAPKPFITQVAETVQGKFGVPLQYSSRQVQAAAAMRSEL